MTVIAYRNGVIASDSLMCAGTGIVGTIKKITKNKKGELAGASGMATQMVSFLRWFEGGERGKKPEDTDDKNYRGIIIRLDGTIEIHEHETYFVLTNKDYAAIGAGGCEARGAMYMGASAEQAVEAAIAHDTSCGGDISSLRLGPSRAVARRKKI